VLCLRFIIAAHYVNKVTFTSYNRGRNVTIKHAIHADHFISLFVRDSHYMYICVLQARLDEAEASSLKGGKRAIQKLDQRIRELEVDLDGEQRRHSETQKIVRKHERRVKELSFQSEEDQKHKEKLEDMNEILLQKINTYKRQVEETVRWTLNFASLNETICFISALRQPHKSCFVLFKYFWSIYVCVSVCLSCKNIISILFFIRHIVVFCLLFFL